MNAFHVRALAAFGIAFLLLVAPGCGNTFRRSYLAPSASLRNLAVIAVLPFENLTDYPNAGNIVADLVATELFALGRYKVVDASTSEKLFSAAGGMPAPAPDRSYAREVGQKIRADAVVYGSVQEYAYRLDKTRMGAREPAVAISLRLVDTATGVVLWSVSESRSSDSLLTEDRDPVSRVALGIVRDLRRRLADHLSQDSDPQVAAPPPPAAQEPLFEETPFVPPAGQQ